jgi:hypothetical protein
MVNSTAIFLDTAGLFLMMMVMRVLSIVVFSVLLVHVELLSLGSHFVHLHGDLLRLGVLVLDVHGGGEGSASSFCFPRWSSQSCPLQWYLGELVGDLDDVDAGGDCQCVLSVLLRHVRLLNLVDLGNFLINFVLDSSFTLLHFRVHN